MADASNEASGMKGELFCTAVGKATFWFQIVYKKNEPFFSPNKSSKGFAKRTVKKKKTMCVYIFYNILRATLSTDPAHSRCLSIQHKTNLFFFFKKIQKKKTKTTHTTRMLPDLARFGGQFPRSGSFSRCGDLVSRSGQIWPDLGIWENFFFKKKKKPPRSGQIWKSGQFFFFLRFLAIVSQGKGLSNFFFRPKIGLISTI